MKHSLIKLKNKLKLRKHMARVGTIKCYSNAEFRYYLNETMDGVLQQQEHRCKNIQPT
jgi:hypothetical protein